MLPIPVLPLLWHVLRPWLLAALVIGVGVYLAGHLEWRP